MPNRLSEAVLSREMGAERPFLAIECDGNLFPQVITAKLEVFLLQALRLHNIMINSGTQRIHEVLPHQGSRKGEAGIFR
jgi:hypothetical protein